MIAPTRGDAALPLGAVRTIRPPVPLYTPPPSPAPPCPPGPLSPPAERVGAAPPRGITPAAIAAQGRSLRRLSAVAPDRLIGRGVDRRAGQHGAGLVRQSAALGPAPRSADPAGAADALPAQSADALGGRGQEAAAGAADAVAAEAAGAADAGGRLVAGKRHGLAAEGRRAGVIEAGARGQPAGAAGAAGAATSLAAHAAGPVGREVRPVAAEGVAALAAFAPGAADRQVGREGHAGEHEPCGGGVVHPAPVGRPTLAARAAPAAGDAATRPAGGSPRDSSDIPSPAPFPARTTRCDVRRDHAIGDRHRPAQVVHAPSVTAQPEVTLPAGPSVRAVPTVLRLLGPMARLLVIVSFARVTLPPRFSRPPPWVAQPLRIVRPDSRTFPLRTSKTRSSVFRRPPVPPSR